MTGQSGPNFVLSSRAIIRRLRSANFLRTLKFTRKPSVSEVMEIPYTPCTTQETRGFSSFLKNSTANPTEPSLVQGLVVALSHDFTGDTTQ